MASETGLSFIDKVPEEYNCFICTNILDEPVLTACCGQHFCKLCLENWFEVRQTRDKSCPHCRENCNYIKDLRQKRKIDILKVYCPNRKQGCGQIFACGELDSHLGTCGFVTVTCTNNCGKHMLRKDHQKHCKQECSRRKVRCQHCGVSGIHKEITTSHLKVCPDLPLVCPRHCGGMGIKRKNLHFHTQRCPLAPVQCPFFEAGCKEEIPRKDLEAHTASNTQHHLQLVLTTSTKNHTQLVSLKKEHESLRTQHHEFQKRHAHLKKEHDSLRKEHDNLKREHYHSKSRNQELEQKFVNLVSCVSREIDHTDLHRDNTSVQCIKTAMLSCTAMLGPRQMPYCLHFTKRSENIFRTPSFYLRPGYKMYLQCDRLSQPTSQGAYYGASVYSSQESFSLILEKSKKEDTLPWPIPKEMEVRVFTEEPAQKDTQHKLCSKCNPNLNLSRVAARNMERVILTWKEYTKILHHGFYGYISLSKHTCPHRRFRGERYRRPLVESDKEVDDDEFETEEVSAHYFYDVAYYN